MKVRLRRKEMGYRQGEFAKLIGISGVYLWKIENGKANNISSKIMKRIAEELHSTVGELFFSEE